MYTVYVLPCCGFDKNALAVHLCSCRIKDRRVLLCFSTAHQSCGLSGSFLPFALKAVAHSLNLVDTFTAEFYFSARKLEYLGKIYVFEDAHHFLYKAFIKPSGVLEATWINHNCCSASSGYCDFSPPGRLLRSRKTFLTADSLLCIP